MPINRNNQNNEAYELRVDTEYKFPVIPLRNVEQILVTIVNTLDKAIDVKLYGALFNDSTMSNPSIDTELSGTDEIPIGSVTTQVASIQTDAQWDFIRVSVQAATAPTTGDVKVVVKGQQRRP